MKTGDTKKKIVFALEIALLVLTLVWIWGHSFASVSQSSAESGRVVLFLQHLLKGVIDETKITDHLVRKTAHFAQFAFLGAQVMFFLLRKSKKYIGAAVAVGAVVAFLDETIQLFSGRGDCIADVWLDIGGVSAGVLFVLLCFKIWCIRTNNM